MEVDIDSATEQELKRHVLDTVEGETCFFRAIMRSRPVGMHRHFHVLSIKHAIEQGTGQSISVDDIWAKLRSCYNLDALESLETENEVQGSNASTPESIPSPSPDQNLALHPFFRTEFTLPPDDIMDNIIMNRRLRSTASLPSSPSPTSPPAKRRRRRATTDKVDMAGLTHGDSDSSALTQETVEEHGQDVRTPTNEIRASVDTGTDAGTETPADEENADETASKPKRGRKPKARTSISSQIKTSATKKKKK